MLRYGWEIYQTLIKMFARTNKRFPNSKEIKWIENQAIRIKDKLLGTGANLEKMSAEEAIQFYARPPKRTPRPSKEYAGIEALPLDNPELRAQALKKTLDARNQQALEKLRSKIPTKDIDDDLFADGGRVGFNIGGLARLKKLYELAKKAKSKLGKAPKTDLKKVRSKVEADKKNIQELADKKQIPVKIEDDIKNIPDSEISKAYKDALKGNDLDLSDNKYDAQIIADYLSNNLYKTNFYDLPKNSQLDIYEKSLDWLMADKMEKAMRVAKQMKGPIDMKTGKNMITGEKVIDVDYIPGEYSLPKKRTLNADGGLITLFMRK